MTVGLIISATVFGGLLKFDIIVAASRASTRNYSNYRSAGVKNTENMIVK